MVEKEIVQKDPEPSAGRSTLSRAPLSRERVLRAAVGLADESGIAALTMRSLAQALDVKPMSLYHHVANKEEILDGIVDLVFAEIELPVPGRDWRAELTRRAVSARRVLRRHPWATALMDSRTSPGPATLRHHDALLGVLRGAGFSVPMAAHAYALLDAYVYGAVVQANSLPFDGPESVAEVAGPIAALFESGQYPHLLELATQHVMRPGYDFGDEFGFGLDLLLDALARALPEHSGPGPGVAAP